MTQTWHYRVSEVSSHINWLYFFHAWHFPTHYSCISQLNTQEERDLWLNSLPRTELPRAKEALVLWHDAQSLLLEWQNKGFTTHFRVRLLEAYSKGDDVWLPTEQLTLPFLRQQHYRADEPCLCWADFIRPFSAGIPDTLGVFASTVSSQMELLNSDDDYNHLLAQTLADRLAEATAEVGHQFVRRSFWAYAPHEDFTPEELFASRYQGCRPAVGYPSLPDQSLIFLLDRLLDFSSIGISLTENGAMLPHASTTGLLFSHPSAQYFSIRRIDNDQLRDYAQRRGLPIETMRTFLSSLLQVPTFV